MGTHVPGFQSSFRFFPSFCIGQISSIRIENKIPSPFNYSYFQNEPAYIEILDPPLSFHSHIVVKTPPATVNSISIIIYQLHRQKDLPLDISIGSNNCLLVLLTLPSSSTEKTQRGPPQLCFNVGIIF